MVAMGTSLYGFMWFWYARANKKREARVISPNHESMTEEQLAELGDDSPYFHFTI